MKHIKKHILVVIRGLLLGMPSMTMAAPEPFIGKIMMFGGNFCPPG